MKIDNANPGSAKIKSTNNIKVIIDFDITCKIGNITPLIALPISVNIFLLKSEEFLPRKKIYF